MGLEPISLWEAHSMLVGLYKQMGNQPYNEHWRSSYVSMKQKMALSLLAEFSDSQFVRKEFLEQNNLVPRYVWTPQFPFGWAYTCTYRKYWVERWKPYQKDINYDNQASSKWESSVVLVLCSLRKTDTSNIHIGERNRFSVPYKFS